MTTGLPTRRLGEGRQRDAIMKESVSKTGKKARPPGAGHAPETASASGLADAQASTPQAGNQPKTTPASRPAAKAASAVTPATAASVKSATAAPGRTTSKIKPTPAPPAAGAGSVETAAGSPAPAHVGPGTDELADKMKPSVVSKVSEVMTKTTKPNSPAQPEGHVLTEDEIRAMSDDDYMNPAQLAFFRAKLQQLEKDLLKNAGETTEHLRETVLVPDPADRATIEEEHALELRTRDRERKLLKKVQQSLASIDSGDYGWCEETGEPIGIPRLIARPTATLSLEAQQRRELKQKLYGD
jgi:DnaK suppressor protein